MDITNLYRALESAETDPTVGIKVVRITGDEGFSLFGGEIEGHKKVRAHYHGQGIETYQIIEGQGIIHLGSPGQGGDVEWKEAVPVAKGDCFTVQPGQVHQLENASPEGLIALFGCPMAHLGSDRIVIQGKD